MQETRPRDVTSDELDLPVLGHDNAPLTIRYFADFLCPHCRNLETGGLRILRERYVDTGKAKLAFVNFPVLGPGSVLAARAARFVWRTAPDVYWEWHRGLFARQGEWEGPEGLADHSRAFAAVDADALREALQGEAFLDEVERERDVARAVGARGTPSMEVGGAVLSAIDPVAVERAIRDALGGGERTTTR